MDNSSPGRTTLILASWGNPFQWSKVEYVLESDESQGERRENISVKSPSSLAPILRKYVSQPGVDNVRALVFVPETLLCMDEKPLEKFREYSKTSPSDILEILSEAAETCRSKCSQGIFDECSNYYQALELIRRAVEEFVKKEVVEVAIPGSWNNSPSELVKVYVLPSIGVYTCYGRKVKIEWRYNQGIDISSFYGALVLIRGFHELVDLTKRPGEKPGLDLVVDITHGLNYMPLMMFRASLFLARLASVILDKEVVFKAYNSEPFSPSVKELMVRVIDRESTDSVKAIQRLVYTFAAYHKRGREARVVKYDGETCGKAWIGTVENRFRQMLSSDLGGVVDYLAASIHFSLPLSLVTFSCWYKDELSGYLDSVGRLLGAIVNDVDRYVYIGKGEEKDVESYLVKRLMVLSYEKVKGLLASYAIAQYSMNALKDLKESEECFRGARRDLYVSVKTLRQLLEKRLRGPHYLTSINELGQIEGRGEGYENPLVKRLREDKCEECCGDGKEVNKRNFIAHGGLEQNVTCVKKKDDTILLKYRSEDDYRKKLENVLRESLDELRELLSR